MAPPSAVGMSGPFGLLWRPLSLELRPPHAVVVVVAVFVREAAWPHSPARRVNLVPDESPQRGWQYLKKGNQPTSSTIIHFGSSPEEKASPCRHTSNNIAILENAAPQPSSNAVIMFSTSPEKEKLY